MNHMYRGLAETERVRRIQEQRLMVKEVVKTALIFALLIAAWVWLPEF